MAASCVVSQVNLSMTNGLVISSVRDRSNSKLCYGPSSQLSHAEDLVNHSKIFTLDVHFLKKIVNSTILNI